MKLFQVQQLILTIDEMRNAQLPGKLTYAFYRNREKLIKLLESIEKTRIDMLKKYAELDEKGDIALLDDGQKVKISPEKEAAFNKEFNEFMIADADIKLYKVNFSVIADLPIEGRFMEVLQYMIEEPDEFKEIANDPG